MEYCKDEKTLNVITIMITIQRNRNKLALLICSQKI